MAKYSLPETVSVALTDVGVGLGKAWFLTVTKNALETRGLVDGKDYAQFVLRTDGTRGERLKAWMANQIYLQGARGPMRHKGYELLRNILPSGSHLINGSKDLFHSRPDVVAVSVHAMAHVNLPGTNPNTLANQKELEEKRFTVAAAVVRRLGIAATLYDELETKRGVDLVENMLRARTGLNINGARELVNFLAKDRRVGDRIKVSPLV
jgi:hypothetical protein